MPLFDLFVPYAVRKQLLQSLSAYDAAKVDMVFGRFLESRERELYLNPMRDLLFNLADVQALEACGLGLVLLGNDVMALQQRLQRPQYYIRKYGHSRKLQIYLVGYCPVITKTNEIRNGLLNFSVFGAPSARRVSEDTLQMEHITAKVTYESLSPDTVFIMSLGAPTQPNERPGFWLRVPSVPDSTVDLRLYVPSLHDRQRGEVRFPWCEAWNLSKCVLRKTWLQSYLVDVLCMCLRIHTLSVAHLTSSGIRAAGPYGRLWSERQIYIQNTVLAGRYVN